MSVQYTGFVENNNSERVDFALEVNLSGGTPTQAAEEALIQALQDYGVAVVGSGTYVSFKKHVDTVTDVTPAP
jgi:hypothetical protein